MDNVIAAESPAALAPAATQTTAGKAPDAPWTAPFGGVRLFALVFLTCGVYSLFYIYKVARDLRDHADSSVTPWLYPLSILLGLANAIAGARLAEVARSLAKEGERKRAAAPGLIGVLIFVAHIAMTLAGTLVATSWLLPAFALFAIPWLLLESQLTVVKAGWPNVQYRSRPRRFTILQWVAVAIGGLVWLGILYGMWQDVARWRGTELAANAAYADPEGRFSLAPSRDGWLVVAPGTVVDDAELELLGPGPSDWAVAHVTEQAGWTLDSVVNNRYTEISSIDESVQFHEKRELVPGTNTVVSRTSYRGRDVLDGEFVFHVAAFVTAERAVELITYSAGPLRLIAGTEELARSFKPLSLEGPDSAE